MLYKIFFLIAIQFLCIDILAVDPWTRLKSPTFAALRNCSFVDSLHGWAAGDSGIIVHTSDGGNTFVIQNTTIDFYINDIHFINNRLGWAVANLAFFEGSTILKTTNGGNVWSAADFDDSTQFLKTIYFLDSLNGYIGGFGGAIYKTTDAGNTWIAAMVDTSKFSGYPISKFDFVTSNFGFACGGHIDIAGVVWKTTNAGLFWTAEGLSPEPFYDIMVKNPQQIFAAGGDYEFGVQISVTSNGGSNWIYQSLGLFGQSESVDFRTPREAWMPLGFARTWAISNDSGRTWSSAPTVDSSEIYSVTFSDSLHGWAVGRDGVILKYNSTLVSSKSNSQNIRLKSYSLHQNYPNPFNPETIINYQLLMFNKVSLKVYDVLGNDVATLVDQNQAPGTYSVKFSGLNHSSGLYFYVLKIEEGYSSEVKFLEAKKMLLLK